MECNLINLDQRKKAAFYSEQPLNIVVHMNGDNITIYDLKLRSEQSAGLITSAKVDGNIKSNL